LSSLEFGAFPTWKGAKRMGGKDMMILTSSIEELVWERQESTRKKQMIRCFGLCEVDACVGAGKSSSASFPVTI
jgi:hypothetical protein